LIETAVAHITPASTPTTRELSGVMYPAQGVMATRPAMAPDAAPSVVGFPYRSRSIRHHPSNPAAVAVLVFMNA
jgi:hypothetical protein